MSENKQEMQEYTFPDEEKLDIEVEDDTPPEDKGKTKSEPEYVESLEKDELTEYSDEVKQKIAGFKKIYHDERREKEKALREHQEAIELAKRLLEENKALKGKVNTSEKVAVDSFKTSAERELDMAKREYREAYEAGDSEKLVEAQEKMTAAKMKVEKASSYAENINQRASLQEQENDVQIPNQIEKPVRDQKALSWQERNSWFGQDDEMTSLALGLHEKLVKENGMAYATTDEYYKRIDETMRKRFPEQFEEPEVEKPAAEPVRKPSNVVAPATRSTSPKRIRLTNTQVALAKKLGLTPEQYALEIKKMEAQNG